MFRPAGPIMIGPGPAHMCAGQTIGLTRPRPYLRIPGPLGDLVSTPLLRNIEVRREPNVIEAPDVGDQLVEQGDPRMAPDAERVDYEQEAAPGAAGAVELGLPDLEHLAGRAQPGHVGEEAEQKVRR